MPPVLQFNSPVPSSLRKPAREQALQGACVRSVWLDLIGNS